MPCQEAMTGHCGMDCTHYKDRSNILMCHKHYINCIFQGGHEMEVAHPGVHKMFSFVALWMVFI